jgi:phosphatidylglycerophosphate synthase
LKARDAWWTVTVIDPVAVPLVRWLTPVRAVTPNRLTLASFALALAAGLLFALGQLVPGAVAVQLSFLVDCMDGKLAGARGESNPMGGVFDGIADAIGDVAIATGLVITTLGDGTIAPVALIAFVMLAWALVDIGHTRTFERETEYLTVPARSGPVLRQASRRSMPPASAVERGLLVYTIAPILGHRAIAVAAVVAVAVALAQYAKYAMLAIREDRRLRAGR